MATQAVHQSIAVPPRVFEHQGYQYRRRRGRTGDGLERRLEGKPGGAKGRGPEEGGHLFPWCGVWRRLCLSSFSDEWARLTRCLESVHEWQLAGEGAGEGHPAHGGVLLGPELGLPTDTTPCGEQAQHVPKAQHMQLHKSSCSCQLVVCPLDLLFDAWVPCMHARAVLGPPPRHAPAGV